MKFKRSKPLAFTDVYRPESSADDQRAGEDGVSDGSALRLDSSLRAERRHRGRGPKPPRSGADEPAFARYAYVVAVVAALVWAGGLAAFVAGFQTQFGAFEYTPLQWSVVGLLAFLPATFMLLSAFALRQGAKLASETHRARALAGDLAIPAALAADQTGGAMEAMRREIEKASEAALAAREPIIALREALALESRRLSEAAVQAQATGRLLTETLGRERNSLSEMAGALQLQAADAAEALARQARIVADTSDLAGAQLDEAQASLTARAADLAVAAGDARHATEVAGAALNSQIEQLETIGSSIGDRIQGLASHLASEREQLAGVGENLRADHEDLEARLESQRAQLAQSAIQARQGAEELAQASTLGADSLRALIATAAEEVRKLAETAHREQADIDAQARAAVGLFSGMVAEERAMIEAQTRAAIDDLAIAAEEARRAAAEHVEFAAEAAQSHVAAARAGLDTVAQDVSAKIDDLGEAAFVAGQKADQAFDSRIAVARRMIEQSALLVEETSDRSVQRMEHGLTSARTMLTDMEGFLADIDQKMARLPEEARIQAATVREAIEAGVGDLTAAARRTAAETQAIDAAFQERVRRNYEVLSDAVRLMGRVAGAAELSRAPAPPAGPAAAPVSPVIKTAAPVIRTPVESAPVAEPMPERLAASGGERSLRANLPDTASTTGRMGTATPAEVVRPAALADPYLDMLADPAPRRADPSVTAASAGLRPRLRLTTPTGPNEPYAPAAPPRAPVPPPASRAPAADPATAMRRPAPPAEADESWTWKNLLSSMDEPSSDDDALADRLIREIDALGIDSGALLPAARIDEIAAAQQAGDASGAREVVRRLAPAAVRRLSRRVLTDRLLRTEADRYVRRYADLLVESAGRDREGYMIVALLESEPGRAFLLLDAAVGDLH